MTWWSRGGIQQPMASLPQGGRFIKGAFRGMEVKTLLFPLGERRTVLSSLEGFKEVSFVANHGVPEGLWDYLQDHGEQYHLWLCRELDVGSEEVAFLYTGADVERVATSQRSSGGLEVWAVVTAGVRGNAMRMGVDRATHGERGGRFYPLETVNILLFASARLTHGAMVRAVVTLTEAKTAAFQELDIRSTYTPLLNQATGTGTDGVILIPGDGPEISSTGGHTLMGELLASATKEAVQEAVRRQDGPGADRGVLERLKERGISLEGMLEAAMAMYVPDPSLGDRERVLPRLREELLKVLEDPNVGSLILAALALEDLARYGAIPSIGPERYGSDPVELLADELIGLQIAQYIGGSRALFEFTRWDRSKPGLIASLPPFLDDAIGGLLAGVMVRVCSQR